jgi:hypothetical protein
MACAVDGFGESPKRQFNEQNVAVSKDTQSNAGELERLFRPLGAFKD